MAIRAVEQPEPASYINLRSLAQIPQGSLASYLIGDLSLRTQIGTRGTGSCLCSDEKEERDNTLHLVQPEAILETARLMLEPLHPSHALALYEPLQSHAIYEFLPEDPPTSSETLAARYQRLSSRRPPEGEEV